MNLKIFLPIFFVLFFVSPVISEEYYTQKDVLDAKTHAFALYNVSKHDEALKILEKIPKKYLTEDICIVKANMYEDKNDLKSTYKNLNIALQLNPKSYKAYYNLGLLAYKENNLELAITNLKKSVKLNSQFPYSHYNLALCYMKEQKYKQAKGELIKAIDLEPNKNFYYNLAYVYKKLNKEKEAKKILESYNAMN